MKLLSAFFIILVSFLFVAALVNFCTSPASMLAIENVMRLLIMLCTACAALLHISRIR